MLAVSFLVFFFCPSSFEHPLVAHSRYCDLFLLRSFGRMFPFVVLAACRCRFCREGDQARGEVVWQAVHSAVVQAAEAGRQIPART